MSKNYDRIIQLRDKLRSMDDEVSIRIGEIETTLAAYSLGVPVELGGYFTWSKNKGEWALWDDESPTTLRRARDAPRAKRASFLDWLGNDLESVIISQLETLVVRRRMALVSTQ